MSDEKFGVLAPPSDERLLATRNEREVRTETVRCSVNPGHQRGGKRLGSLSVVLPEKHETDFIWTWHNDCLISPHALNVLMKNQLTGFEAKPAVIHSKKQPTETPKYLEFRPIGWGGIAPESSGVELIEYCEACGATEYSAYTNPEFLVDSSQWDGSDFFIVWPLPRFIFVSSHAHRVIADNQITGAVIEPLAALKPGLAKGFSPGKLDYWFPGDRVRELKSKCDGIEGIN